MKTLARVPEEKVMERFRSLNIHDLSELIGREYRPDMYEKITYAVWTDYEQDGGAALAELMTMRGGIIKAERGRLCFSDIMHRLPEPRLKIDELCTYMAFWHNLDVHSVPCGEEYLRTILNTSAARFLCYNIDQFLAGEGPLVIRVTPYNTLWYSVIGMIRHIREYGEFARRAIMHMKRGYPLWLTVKVLSHFECFNVVGDIVENGRILNTSHTVLKSKSPVVPSVWYMALNPSNAVEMQRMYGNAIKVSTSLVPESPIMEYVEKRGISIDSLVSDQSHKQVNFLMSDRKKASYMLPEGVVDSYIKEIVHGNAEDRGAAIDGMPVSEKGWIELP